MDKLAKVRAEVERRMFEDYNSGDEEQDSIAQGVCAGLLHFIDSLQEEPVSEELEQAAIDYDSCRPALYGEDDEGDYVEYIEVRKDAFIAGAQWQKEQMMAKAVDATLLKGNLIKQKRTTHPLHIGDKVKVIVIKED